MKIEMKIMMTLAIALGAVLVATPQAHAVSGPSAYTYEGRVFDTSSNPSQRTVKFNVKVLNHAATCILRSETTAAIDLSLTDGYFSVQVGKGATATDDPGLALFDVYRTDKSVTGKDISTGSVCSTSLTAGDDRLLRITVIDTGVSTVMSPDISIGTTPYAMVADSVQGKTPTDLLLVNTSTALTQSNLESVFQTSALVTELNNLIAGNSTNYAKTAGTNSFSGTVSFGGTTSFTSPPTSSSSPTGPTMLVNKQYADSKIGGATLDTSVSTLTSATPDINKALRWDGTKWIAGVAGITAINAGAGILVTTSGSTATVAADSGITASKLVQLDASAKLPSLDASQLYNINATKLNGTTISGLAPTTGYSLVYSGSQWVPMLPAANGVMGMDALKVGTSQLITSNGNVGIGTTSPTAPLQVYAPAGPTGSALLVSSDSTTGSAATLKGVSTMYPAVTVTNGGSGDALQVGNLTDAGTPIKFIKRITGANCTISSLSANASGSCTVSVTPPLVLGDDVRCFPATTPTYAIVHSCYVSSSGIVSINVHNIGVSVQTPPSSWNIVITKF